MLNEKLREEIEGKKLEIYPPSTSESLEERVRREIEQLAFKRGCKEYAQKYQDEKDEHENTKAILKDANRLYQDKSDKNDELYKAYQTAQEKLDEAVELLREIDKGAETLLPGKLWRRINEFLKSRVG